jgi:hypothetical protein
MFYFTSTCRPSQSTCTCMNLVFDDLATATWFSGWRTGLIFPRGTMYLECDSPFLFPLHGHFILYISKYDESCLVPVYNNVAAATHLCLCLYLTTRINYTETPLETSYKTKTASTVHFFVSEDGGMGDSSRVHYCWHRRAACNNQDESTQN